MFATSVGYHCYITHVANTFVSDHTCDKCDNGGCEGTGFRSLQECPFRQMFQKKAHTYSFDEESCIENHACNERVGRPAMIADEYDVHAAEIGCCVLFYLELARGRWIWKLAYFVISRTAQCIIKKHIMHIPFWLKA
eukprot:TRINITY_DN31582_c0_g1_i1.p2 TRINITY_DN31582_c0_g1~~TRINITY_DN31582_c0_g1_i1.p2  ORF type:complete len:137 (+),score=14.02 TRINITY_DN31582_c0_g1_i1:1298-1708(+)